MDAIALLRSRILPYFQPEFQNLPKATGKCEVFGGEIEGYLNVDSYGIQTVQSDILRIFTQPSYDVIGFAMGTREEPKQAMRLIDYKNAWLIVPVGEDQPELWCGGKYPEKTSSITPFKIRNLSGNQALLELLNDDRPYLAVGLSPRKELYLKNMLVGDTNNLVICQESGTIITPRKNWTEFKEIYLSLEKKMRSEALNILRGINTGRLDQSSETVQKFFQKNILFAQKSGALLPLNPHARNIWFSALGAL